MNREAHEVMFAAFFDELGQIEKEAMEKEAFIGALKGIGAAIGSAGGLANVARSVAKPLMTRGQSVMQAGRVAMKDPTQAMNLMRGAYQRAGGGLKGVGAVMKTPVGQAAALTGGTALAVPAVGGYAAGRAR